MSKYKGSPVAENSIVSRDPNMMSGAAVFAGTRVPITDLFEFLARGFTINDFCSASPSVDAEDVKALLLRLGDMVENGDVEV